MKILVTGGAGFIGSAIVRDLLAAGHAARVIDDLSTGRRENLPEDSRLEFFEGSILDDGKLAAACAGCDAVSHQAAMVSVPRSIEEPALCAELNVEGTRRVLEAARAAGARRAVIASSAAVYGNDAPLPVREGAATAPISPYGESKLAAEVAAAALAGPDFQVVALRYFNVYGPRQALSGGYPALLPPLAIAAATGRPFSVCGDGLQTRDFVFVGDVARANRLALEAALGTPFVALNIGAGTETSVLDAVAAVGRASGKAVATETAPARPGDIRRSVADASRAAEVLGWRAEKPFLDGAGETYAYYVSLHSGAREV